MAAPGASNETSTNIFRQAAEAALRSVQDHVGQQERCGHFANLTIVHFLECVPPAPRLLCGSLDALQEASLGLFATFWFRSSSLLAVAASDCEPQRAQRRAVRDTYRAGNADPNKVRVLREAAMSVRDFPTRIWNGEMLEACRGIGAQFRMVSIWNRYVYGAPKQALSCKLALKACFGVCV